MGFVFSVQLPNDSSEIIGKAISQHFSPELKRNVRIAGGQSLREFDFMRSFARPDRLANFQIRTQRGRFKKVVRQFRIVFCNSSDGVCSKAQENQQCVTVFAVGRISDLQSGVNVLLDKGK